jgi:hypothetical protein
VHHAGWGNNELECYTEQPSNAAIIPDPNNKSNSILSISAVYQKGYVCSNMQVTHPKVTEIAVPYIISK